MTLEDCGANGCIFAPTATGMRTNGGCQHLKADPHEMRRLLRDAAALLAVNGAALGEARRERDEARADLESVWHVAGEKLGDDRGMDAYTPADAMTNILDSLIAERDEARAAAIEECAKVCDEVATIALANRLPGTRGTARLIAARLRALLEPGT